MSRKFQKTAALAALGMAIMTACTNDDELVGGNYPLDSSRSVSFNVNSFRTRATETNTTNYLTQVQDFQVWGFFAPDATGNGVTSGAQYMGTNATTGVKINGNGTGEWNYDKISEMALWPQETAKLNFQAITPAADASFTIENTVSNKLAHVVANVTVPTDNALQRDIMFASAVNQTSTTNNKCVDLAFEHAMSQILFKAKVKSSSISAEISDITIKNLKNKGKVGFISDDGAAVSLSAAVEDGSFDSYPIGMDTKTVNTTTAVDITKEGGALMLLPQKTFAWNTSDSDPVTIAQADADHLSYIVVTCKLKQNTDYIVGSASAYGKLYIPFSANWEQGKKYTYTLNIGDNGNVYDENGAPITMANISFSASVKDWTAVDGDVNDLIFRVDKTAVDLGLPSGLKWAAGNVGATSPEDPGLYFAWGETTGYAKDAGHMFDNANYTASSISTNLSLEQDAAHVNLGGNWRMPTKTEFEELINNTTRTWTSNYNGTGVKGYIVTSKTNGKSIFFPAAGYFRGSSSVSDFGSGGYYWSSTWYSSSNAYHLYFDSSSFNTGSSSRYYGYSVRGVCE